MKRIGTMRHLPWSLGLWWAIDAAPAFAQSPDAPPVETTADTAAEAPADPAMLAVPVGADGEPAVEVAPVVYVTPVGAPDVRDAVVVVKQAGGTCAGAILDDGRILTAWHCVTEGFEARIDTRDGRSGTARVIASVVADDLALLSPEDPGLVAGLPALRLAPEAPDVGATVEVVGHPMAAVVPFGFLAGTLRWSISQGFVSSSGPIALQFTAPVNPGNSGGPVLNTRGEIVGIVSRKAGEGLGFAARVERVHAFLDSPRPHTFLGGSLQGFVSVSTPTARTGAPAVGFALEAALRDRVLLTVEAQLPIVTERRLEEEGVLTTAPLAASLGVRQRLGHAVLAPRLDLFVGVAGLDTRAADDTPGQPERSLRATLIAGGRLEIGGLGVELGVMPLERATWTPVRLNIRARLPSRRGF